MLFFLALACLVVCEHIYLDVIIENILCLRLEGLLALGQLLALEHDIALSLFARFLLGLGCFLYFHALLLVLLGASLVFRLKLAVSLYRLFTCESSLVADVERYRVRCESECEHNEHDSARDEQNVCRYLLDRAYEQAGDKSTHSTAYVHNSFTPDKECDRIVYEFGVGDDYRVQKCREHYHAAERKAKERADAALGYCPLPHDSTQNEKRRDQPRAPAEQPIRA